MRLESCIEINTEEDIVRARQSGRLLAQKIGFDEVGQSEIATTISELARNIYLYARDGFICVTYIKKEDRAGLRIRAQDQGPGIADLQKVMENGFSTSGGLGASLPGIQKIMDDFSISSTEGKGTKITAMKWLQEMGAREDAR